MSSYLVDARLLDVAQGSREPSDSTTVEGACLEPRRIVLRLMPVIGMDAGAADLPGPDLDPVTDAEPACPLRPHQALVPREAEHINGACIHLDGDRTCSLRGIDDEDEAMLMREGPDAGDVCLVAAHVGGMVHDDELRVRLQKALELLQAEPSRLIGPHEAHVHTPLVLQAEERTQHRIVLGHGRDRMVSGPSSPMRAMFRASVELAVKQTWSGRQPKRRASCWRQRKSTLGKR